MNVIFTTLTGVWICSTVFQPISGVTVDKGTLEGNIYGVAGSYTTMVCDLRDIDANPIYFSNPTYYLNKGEILDDSLPTYIVNRIVITCSAPTEACYLTISDLKLNDAGRYGCGYFHQATGNRIGLTTAYLVITEPPKETFPMCVIYDGRNNQEISSDMANIGDQLLFVCFIEAGDPSPTIYIARNGLKISQLEKVSFSKSYTLSQSDEGSTFTCVMTHPALAQSRNCTFLTLPSRETTTMKTTTFQSSHKSTSMLSTPAVDPGTAVYPGQSSMALSTIITVVVFVTLFLIIMSVLFVLWFVKRKRSDKDKIKTYSPPSSLDLKMENMVPPETVSTEYDVVNIRRDSKEKQDEPSTIQITENISVDDDFPVYAKPDKSSRRNTLEADTVTRPCQYENISPVSDGGNTCNGEDGIMYAELELSVDVSNGSSQISKEPYDATVYADIQTSS